MEEATYNPFLQPLFKMISLLDASFHYIIEVMNLLHDVLDMGKHWFAIYHQYYKEKLISNLKQTFAYVAKPGLAAKKSQLPKTSLHLVSCLFKPLSLFSSTLLKLPPAIFKYNLMSECLAIWKYTAMSRWHLSLTFATFLLADCLSVKLAIEISLKLSYVAPTVKFLPDNIALPKKWLQWPINNLFWGLYHIKLAQDFLCILSTIMSPAPMITNWKGLVGTRIIPQMIR